MLQFWKKSSPKKSRNGYQGGLEHDIGVRAGPLSRFKSESIGNEPCEKSSRLSLTLEDTLHNKTALSYLSQFMESRGHTNLFNMLADLETLPFRLQPLGGTRSTATTPTEENHMTVKQIYDKYLSEESPFKVKMPDDVKLAILVGLNSDQTDQLNKLKTAIVNLIKKDVWSDFIKSDWHCKYQIEIMTSRSMRLNDVLYNDTCLGAFLDFLDMEGLSTVIEFWLAATSFEKQYQNDSTIDPEFIQNEAMAIYDKFLSLQATLPLGICDKVRFAVEEGICGETRTSPDCFKPAQVAVEDFLSQSCLKHFLSSQQYLGVLSEVMATSSMTSSIKSNPSPASSVTEGSIDCSKASQVHSDAEWLWRRRKHNGGLSFGRIDQLGRYESDIGREPEKKESRISRVVKLLMSKDEQKAQEEMAWRVAEMIVKDITSITMAPPESQDV